MEALLAEFQQRYEQAKGSMLETTYQIILAELSSGREMIDIKNHLHVFELTSSGEKEQVLSEARHRVEHIMWE